MTIAREGVFVTGEKSCCQDRRREGVVVIGGALVCCRVSSRYWCVQEVSAGERVCCHNSSR